MTIARQPLSSLASESPEGRPAKVDSRPIRHYGQWLAAAILLFFVAGVIVEIVRNPNLDYSYFWDNITAETVLKGLGVTLALTLVGMTVGIVLGTVIAVARMSGNRVLQTIGGFYVWFTRGIPLLVQILIWGNFALLFPELSIGIPFTDIVFLSVSTNAVLTTFVASCIALGLNEAAYMAEIVRGGILGVDRGQDEAATALGMSPGQAMRRVVLPQALRLIIPPTGNQFITLLKSSSLVAVIAGGDLMTAVNDISASNYRIIELLIVACFWYLVLVTILSIGQHFLEKRASRGHSR
jgi:polar amino acid transport system permease protein